MTDADDGRRPARDPASTVALLHAATEQVTRLVRAEVRLAQAELAARSRRAGKGAALLAVSGVVALYGLGTALVAAVLLLDLVVPGWLAALIVVGLAVAVAAGLAFLGVRRFRRLGSAMPLHVVASVKADVQAVLAALAGRRPR